MPLAFLVVLLPVAGLAMRSRAGLLPPFIAAYGPDMMWALLVFSAAALLAPRLSTGKLAACTLAFAYLVECSQIYQAPWINAIRATRIGGLLLGSTFVWSDLVCYTAGIGVGCLLDYAISIRVLRTPSMRRGLE